MFVSWNVKFYEDIFPYTPFNAKAFLEPQNPLSTKNNAIPQIINYEAFPSNRHFEESDCVNALELSSAIEQHDLNLPLRDQMDLSLPRWVTKAPNYLNEYQVGIAL